MQRPVDPLFPNRSLASCMSAEAAQEGCDGEEYDLLEMGAKRIEELEKDLNDLNKCVSCDSAAPVLCRACVKEVRSEYEQWKPIDTAPKDGTRILVTDGDDCYVATWGGAVGEWIYGTVMPGFDPMIYLEVDATHWMPLPANPEPPDKDS